MPELVCKICLRSAYLQAFSFGKCKICGTDIVCPHIGCYAVCDECAERLSLCKQCGNPIK